MAYPTILFNASTGSDSLSSGAGPATAINGSGASLNGTTTVDLSADSPDLSGVATDGSACLWVQTSSGRQFSQITATDNSLKTVTVNTAYSVTESSRNWAIGGKRATWDNADSRTVFFDAQQGWDIVTETNQSLTSSLSITADGTTNGSVTVRGSDPNTLKQIIQTTNAKGLQLDIASYVTIKDLHIVTNITNTNTAIASRGSFQVFCNILIDDAGGFSWQNGFSRNGGTPAGNLYNVRIYDCTGDGFSDVGTGPIIGRFVNCVSSNNGGNGISSNVPVHLINCLFCGNGSNGILADAECFVARCATSGNADDGIEVTGYGSLVVDNVITSNGGYGINADAEWKYGGVANSNAFFGNTSGQVNNITNGPDDITLTADPFTDAANGDFTLNTTAGGGAELRSNAFTLGATETRPFRWLDVSAGTGGGVRQVNIRGGADQ